MSNDLDFSGEELKARFTQLARAELPFNPVDVIDITGANVARLQKSMKSFGWRDPRFVTKAQAVSNGWTIKPQAESVEVLVRNVQTGLTENLPLFNAGVVVGMPSLAAMLAMSDAEIEKMRGLGPVVEGEDDRGLSIEPARVIDKSVPEPGKVERVDVVEGELSIGPARSVLHEVGETLPEVVVDRRLRAVEDNWRGLVHVSTNALTEAEASEFVAEDISALRGITNTEDRRYAASLMGANTHDQQSYFSELARQSPEIAVEAVEALKQRNVRADLEEQAPVDSMARPIDGEALSAGIEGVAALDRFAAMAPYWLDGLHNFEGLALAQKINLEIKARGLAEDRDAIAQLMAVHSKARSLGIGVVPEMQYLNDPELKRNRGEPASLLDGALVRDKEGAYRPKAGGPAMIQDRGESVVLKGKSAESHRGAMELAVAKGWKAIELKGSKAMLSEAWVEAKLLGLEVVGYAPNEKDHAKYSARVAVESRLKEPMHVRPLEQAAERVEVRPFIGANGQQKTATMTYTVSYKGGETAEFGNAKDAAKAFAGLSSADSPVVVRSVIRADGVVAEGVVAGVAQGIGKGGLNQASEKMLDHEFDDAMDVIVAQEKAQASLEPGRVEAVASGMHFGPIVAIEGDRVAQKTGRQVVWHDKAKLKGAVPKLGEMAEIGYAKGLGIIKKNALEAERAGGDRGLER